MKSFKRISSLFLAVLLVVALFAGCSSSEKMTEDITDETMIFAYTEENEPFLYKDDEGNWAGFDADLVAAVFDSIKGDYSDYTFVQVDPDYVLGEDTVYTDEDGNEYSALIFCGGYTKNTGTADEDFDWSANLLENCVVTIVPLDSSISTYNDIEGKTAAVVSGSAVDALDKQAAVENIIKYNIFDDASGAFEALDSGKADMVIIDQFSLYAYDGYSEDKYTTLDGILDSTEYAFAFATNEDYAESFDEAVKEMKSPDYNNADTLTPLVEQYFGSADLCIFDYE